MILCVIVIGVGVYYYFNRKKVTINEKNNKEYFYVINPNDGIMQSDPKYICSQHRRRDLEDVVSMDIIR